MHGRAPSGAALRGRWRGSRRQAKPTRWLGSSRYRSSMRRGDVVTVAAAGDYGKPRPAVIVQSDAFPEGHASVVICQMTSEIVDASAFRVTIEPSAENGLRIRSQVMADK